jgi:hypothetical protein
MDSNENTLDYGFSLALQARHPKLPVDAWTKALRQKPVRSWRTGEPRTTPAGRRLDGSYRESYGCWDLAQGRGDVLVRRLFAVTKKLAKHRAFFRRWRATGGTVAYYLTLSGQRTVPVEMPPELLAEMGNLGVRLGVEVLLAVG